MAEQVVKKYTVKEIVLATDNFAWQLRSESVGIWGNVFKGYINNNVVSVKFLNSHQPYFESRVKSLSLTVGHPRLLNLIGICSQLECFVYEYIEPSGSLQEVMKQKLEWRDRIGIVNDICSALCYIEKSRCEGIVPDYLTAASILVDSDLRAKVNNVPIPVHGELELIKDVKTFGYLILRLLTGIPGNFVTYCYVRCFGVLNCLDKKAGWPTDLAEKLMNLCQRCVSINPHDDLRKKYIMLIIVKEMNAIREMAGEIDAKVSEETYETIVTKCRDQASSDVPRQFYCPIYKEVMRDPYLAADGFSYEKEGIEKWLKAGHDRSPLTNLKLENKILTPNSTLKHLIKDWYNERSLPHPNA